MDGGDTPDDNVGLCGDFMGSVWIYFHMKS